MLEEKNVWAKRCFRMLIGSILLSILLSFEYYGIPMTFLKYSAFFAIAVIAGYSPRKKQAPFPKRYAVFCVVLTLVFTILLSYLLPSDVPNEEIGVLWILSVAVFTPIAEELFFRGALVVLENPVITCIVSSLIFGVFHPDGWLQTFLMGVLFAVFYISSRNIAIPIICHSANNLLAVLCILGDVRIPILIISAVTLIFWYIIGVKNEKKVL